VSYGGGTGTLAVPSPTLVAIGVPTDDTVGSYAPAGGLDEAELHDALDSYTNKADWKATGFATPSDLPADFETLTIADGKVNAVLDSSSINAVSDQVWDEAYADHNTAGSFGKLLNTIRKANLAVEGTVTNAVAPTTTTFTSNVSATTGAYEHAVLLFTSGALTGENSPIITYTSTNGAIVLEEALTSAPTVNDEFVIIAGSHVHSVASIQSGLSTLTAANVNAEVVDALSVDTYAELSSPPAATSSLKDKLTWLFMYARNKVTQTAVQRKLYRDDGTTVAGTSGTTDDGTTFTKGEDA
jgi:hypothetical protein